MESKRGQRHLDSNSISQVPSSLLGRLQRQSVANRLIEDASAMLVMSAQNGEPKTHLKEGAIYRDSSNNVTRLLSIRRHYCAYVYIALGDPRWEVHGTTGVTRRNVFEAGFVFIAERVGDWNWSPHKSSGGRTQGLTTHHPSSALGPAPQKRRF
jgi:hypothetical protein